MDDAGREFYPPDENHQETELNETYAAYEDASDDSGVDPSETREEYNSEDESPNGKRR